MLGLFPRLKQNRGKYRHYFAESVRIGVIENGASASHDVCEEH